MLLAVDRAVKSAKRSGLPSSPSKPDHRPCSRHRKVRHVAREGRCGEERQTAWLSSSRCTLSRRSSHEQGGQGRQPRTGEDRRLTGVPACRNRVADIGSRISRLREARWRPTAETPWRKSFRAWAGARPRGGKSRMPSKDGGRALRVTGRYFIGPTHFQLVGLTRGGEILQAVATGIDDVLECSCTHFRRKALRVVTRPLPFTGPWQHAT